MPAARAVLWAFVAFASAAGVRDVDGRPFDPFWPAGKAGVVVFVSTDCPVSNGYAPAIQRLCEQYRSRGAACSLVYEDLHVDARAVKAHLADYRYRDIPAAIDGDRQLAKRAQATVTPEAVVIDAKGDIRYRGRIDNKYVTLGTARQVVTEHDLGDAIDAVLAGRPVARPRTEAVGCFIPSASIK